MVIVNGIPQPFKPGFSWRTKAELFGLPLIHIAWGLNPQRKPNIACGILAIGQFARGVVVIAQFGMGGIVIAQFGAGVLVVSQFAAAAAAIAMFGLAGTGAFMMGACLRGVGLLVLQLPQPAGPEL